MRWHDSAVAKRKSITVAVTNINCVKGDAVDYHSTIHYQRHFINPSNFAQNNVIKLAIQSAETWRQMERRKPRNPRPSDVLRRRLGIEGGALDWMVDFLNTRSQVVRFGSGESDVVNTQFGVPQGSVLGPKRFLQHAEDVCPLMSRLQYHMFADDMQGLKQTVIITISYFVSNLPVILVTRYCFYYYYFYYRSTVCNAPSVNL